MKFHIPLKCAAFGLIPLVFASPLLATPSNSRFAPVRPTDEAGEPQLVEVKTSALTQTAVPPGTYRVKRKTVPAQYNQLLEIYIKSHPSFSQGQTELLVFTDETSRKPDLSRLRIRFETQLKAAGWDYQIAGKENDITFFTAVKKTPTRQNIFGYWVPEKKGLMLAMEQVLVAGQSSTTKDVTPVMTTNSPGSSASLPPQIAQVVIAKGAQPYNDAQLRAQLGELLQTFGAERKLPSANGQNTQIWSWSGQNYQAGRLAFWRSALQKSLEGAGYEVKEFDSHEVATNIYEGQFGLATYDNARPGRDFWLETGDPFFYFTAVNRTSGQAVAGVWVEFLEAKRVLLAAAPLGTATLPAPTKLPAVSGANVVEVKHPTDVMKGVAPPKNPAFAPRSLRGGMAAGQIKDWNGKPIAGAMISVQSSALGGFRTYVTAKTDAQGVYAVTLPVGACQIVEAYCRVVYNGKPLFLPLRAADGTNEVFNSKTGHVENFVLRYWGVADADRAATDSKEGAYYYGASLRVQWFTDGLPQNGTVQVTLKPQGALLGGGEGRTLVLRMPATKDTILMADHFINDLPIGRYQMTAQLIDGGETMPLKIEKIFGNDAPVEALVVDFQSEGNDYAAPDRSGIKRYDVMLKP